MHIDGEGRKGINRIVAMELIQVSKVSQHCSYTISYPYHGTHNDFQVIFFCLFPLHVFEENAIVFIVNAMHLFQACIYIYIMEPVMFLFKNKLTFHIRLYIYIYIYIWMFCVVKKYSLVYESSIYPYINNYIPMSFLLLF